MFRKQVLLFACILFCLALSAQNMGTVAGVVSDSSGTPVELVTVTLKEYPKYATSTDKNGAFEMQVPANVQVTLVFSSLNIYPAELIVVVDADERLQGIKQKVTLKQHNIPVTEIKGKRTEEACTRHIQG